MTLNNHMAFDKLFYKVAISKFAIEHLEEVQSFYSELPTSDFDHIKFKTQSLISAIYFMNNMNENSLNIDLELLRSHSPCLNDCVVILRAIKTSVELGRADEVMSYAVRFLKDQHTIWSCKLPILAWYTKLSTDQENTYSEYEDILSGITEKMDVQVDNSKSFINRIEDIYNEYLRGSKDLHSFHLTYANTPVDRKAKLVAEYLDQEKVGFYRAQVLANYKKE